MKILITITAVLAALLLFGLIRSKQLEREAEAERRAKVELAIEARAELENSLLSALLKHQVAKPVMVLKGDEAEVGGVVMSAQKRQLFLAEISEIKDGDLTIVDDGLMVYGSIAGVKKGKTFTLSGELSDELPLDKVMSGLNEMPIIQAKELQRASYYLTPPEVAKAAFQSWLSSYTEHRGNRSFSLKGNTITLKGEATKGMVRIWVRELRHLRLNIENQLDGYESEMRFPSYSYHDDYTLSTEELDLLNDELALIDIVFESGYSRAESRQFFKLDILAAVIKSTGSRAPFAIGAFADQTGDVSANEALSSNRIKYVLHELEQRGVDVDRIEVLPLNGANAGRYQLQDIQRRVKIFINEAS